MKSVEATRMRLRTVLAVSELKLVLLTGGEHLDRPVRWVYTTDQRDPSRYLSGGELVLTGMVWRRGPADAEAFVSAIAAAGVAGLAAGDAEFGSVPVDLIEACARHGVPLFEVPIDVSFATITERIVLTLANDRSDGAALALDRHRRLVEAVADGAGLTTLLELGSTGIGAHCWVLSPTGRVVAGSSRPPSPARRELLVRQFLQADRLPRTVRHRDSSPCTLLPVPGRGGQRMASWFLVVDGDQEQWDAGQREVAGELATLVSLDRTRLEERRRVENRAFAPLLHAITAGRAGPGEIESRLAAAGLAPGDPVCVLFAATVGGGPGLAALVLGELAAERANRVLLGTIGEQACAVLSGSAEKLTVALRELRAAVEIVEPGLGSARLVIGISGITGAAGLAGAVEEARHARTLAEHRDGRTAVVAAEEIASHLLLLATVPEELRRSFADRLLGSLRAYDAEHGSDLLATLRVFLECSGSPTKTAAKLHVHVNTLRYRIARIEELTGRDLGSFPDRVDLYLGLNLSPG
ncbi:PucR family transcriptional regulator [Crossiella cryophila]|uniref:PucR family transcriptional regulator n=1 Tax=Crossiella cryophila TaxID=43355 RepID=A0A7W7FXS7_9PSEU|nr:PucR family transcriptional regulator ligand-binding domain-containing protein [Crossiella cryophila]MBB4681622.1 hypothetical protein [Crossiella cryophila]